jgi:hypothetical protein
MIVDCIMFSYEHDALSVRLAELNDVVDVHLVVQGSKTFRGDPREIVKLEHPKIINEVVDFPAGLRSPWHYEKYQRDMTVTLAKHHFGHEDDMWVIVADADEIPHPEAIKSATRPQKLGTDYREWFADWRAPGDWQPTHQPFMAPAELVGSAHDHRFQHTWRQRNPLFGWHLSTLGDDALAHQKIREFSHSEYDTSEWTDRDRLAAVRSHGIDIFERFTLEQTADLPGCIADFPHLLGGPIPSP